METGSEGRWAFNGGQWEVTRISILVFYPFSWDAHSFNDLFNEPLHTGQHAHLRDTLPGIELYLTYTAEFCGRAVCLSWHKLG